MLQHALQNFVTANYFVTSFVCFTTTSFNMAEEEGLLSNNNNEMESHSLSSLSHVYTEKMFWQIVRSNYETNSDILLVYRILLLV
jgi:hypothetical protein